MTEAELLFTDVLGCDKLSLYLDRNIVLGFDKTAQISSALRRRILREPIQHILEKTEFMGLEFKVTPDVLIPRPETEILVEKTIELVARHKAQGTRQNILDIGTGSGCIAVSLAKFLPEVKITATDISEKALEVARENARLNNVEVDFLLADLFATCNLHLAPCDLIISNPPYVPSAEIAGLQPEVQYEPRIALDGGKDGLDFYRKIVLQAPDYLKEEGLLIMEMGFTQAEAIKNIFKGSAKFEIIDIVKDYNNIDRVIVAERG